MKLSTGMALGVVAGIAIGAATVQSLHAQAKAPVYYVAEIDASDPEAYAKEYVPKAQALITAAGGRYVASGGTGSSGTVVGFDGEPPKSRVVIILWDSIEQIQAWHSSPEYQKGRKTVDQYAKFRSFTVDSLPQ